MRITLDKVHLQTAKLWAQRSTCTRRKVGCVITDEAGHILSVGYNGVPKGFEHCTETKCLGSCAKSGQALDDCNAIHAEQNAIARLNDYTKAHNIYCTTKPCTSCMKLILATNIKNVFFLEDYPTNSILYTILHLEQISE